MSGQSYTHLRARFSTFFAFHINSNSSASEAISSSPIKHSPSTNQQTPGCFWRDNLLDAAEKIPASQPRDLGDRLDAMTEIVYRASISSSPKGATFEHTVECKSALRESMIYVAVEERAKPDR